MALNTCEGHLDYLSPPNITWSLVNDDFTVEERQVLATALLARLEERVLNLPPNRPVYLGPAFPWDHRFWPVDGSLPALDQFVSLESFLVFNILQNTNEEIRELLQVFFNTYLP